MPRVNISNTAPRETRRRNVLLRPTNWAMPAGAGWLACAAGLAASKVVMRSFPGDRLRAITCFLGENRMPTPKVKFLSRSRRSSRRSLRAMLHRPALLLLSRLHLHKPHPRPANRLADRATRRRHLVAKPRQVARPVMGRGTSFHVHQARDTGAS